MNAFTQCVMAAALAISSLAASGQGAQDNPFGTPRSQQQWVSVEEASPVPVAPGKTASARLEFRVSEGNHVNSSKPGSELLIPTQLKLEAPTGISVGKIAYPAGRDVTFPFAEETLNVYTGSFTVIVPVKAGAKAGSFPVHGELTYQACNDRACFPPRHLPVEFEVKVAKLSH
jgi:DsbC/DsbD-like thiol-disulfide interchange protein